jgi:carotenoid cleavage dioxygenase
MTKLKERAASWISKQAQKRAPVSGENPFLEGQFAPVEVETTSTQLDVIGTIPAELNGVLARIGPNPIEVPNPATYHWFVGDGMVHGVRLRDGKALWYRNRWVGTDKANKALGRPLIPGQRHGIVDAVNTNIIGHGGRLWALVEAGAVPVEMNFELDSVKHGLFDHDQPGPFSAHPHLDPHTGELHAICYNATQPNQIVYQVIDKTCRLTHSVRIPVKHGPMIHDCAITRSKVLILDLPVTFSLRSVLQGATFPYHWNPRHAARVGLLPRTGGAKDIRWLHVEPCYVFHTGNARDLENGDVVVDVVVHDRMFDRSIQGPEAQKVTLEQWILPAQSDTVQRQVISDRTQEFPRFDERLTGQDSRYTYTVGSDLANPDSAQPLLRYDMNSGACEQHLYGNSKISGEAVFVPRKVQGAESDGWLLSYVYDVADNSSELVILNADDISGEPQAVIKLPVRVPMGFHGNWVPAPE